MCNYQAVMNVFDAALSSPERFSVLRLAQLEHHFLIQFTLLEEYHVNHHTPFVCLQDVENYGDGVHCQEKWHVDIERPEL